MMYAWNIFTLIACCESLIDFVLDRVHVTLKELADVDRLSQQHHRYFYDNYCLAMLIKGVCLRHKHNAEEALACFQFIAAQWVHQHFATEQRDNWHIRYSIDRMASNFSTMLAPRGPGAIPPYPFTSPLPYLLLYLSVSFFLFLLASSIFLLFHPFPFYQNSPTPFPGRMSIYPSIIHVITLQSGHTLHVQLFLLSLKLWLCGMTEMCISLLLLWLLPE